MSNIWFIDVAHKFGGGWFLYINDLTIYLALFLLILWNVIKKGGDSTHE